jgi:hypothetical protein
LPSKRDFSAAFGKKVIKGTKKLLSLRNVKYVHNVSSFPRYPHYFQAPKYNQLSARRIWAEVKNKPDIAIYFPEMKGKRVPQR